MKEAILTLMASPHGELYNELVKSLEIGKVLYPDTYVHESAMVTHYLPVALTTFVRKLKDILGLDLRFNLLKLNRKDLKISFLSYPNFSTDPHPALAIAVSVDLSLGEFKVTDYSQRKNPPILHRKETFLIPNHPDTPTYVQMTQDEEKQGLYKNTRIIGTKLRWEELLTNKGLKYDGHTLITGE